MIEQIVQYMFVLVLALHCEVQKQLVWPVPFSERFDGPSPPQVKVSDVPFS